LLRRQACAPEPGGGHAGGSFSPPANAAGLLTGQSAARRGLLKLEPMLLILLPLPLFRLLPLPLRLRLGFALPLFKGAPVLLGPLPLPFVGLFPLPLRFRILLALSLRGCLALLAVNRSLLLLGRCGPDPGGRGDEAEPGQ
jgi:hypothetical protein